MWVLRRAVYPFANLPVLRELCPSSQFLLGLQMLRRPQADDMEISSEGNEVLLFDFISLLSLYKLS